MQDIQAIEPVSAPWAWTPGDLDQTDNWIIQLDDRALEDIGAALATVKARGIGLGDISRQDFPLPTMARSLAAAKSLLSEGPGLCLVRGLPSTEYDRDDLAIILWGIGTHIGEAVTQSYRGDLVGDVMDMSHTGDTRRSYRSPRPLHMHVDPVDVVALLCVRRAKTGGTSVLTSGITVHNTILAERPDLMPALYRGYHYRASEASSTGQRPTTPYRVPVFAKLDGRLTCNFNDSPVRRSIANDAIDNDAKALEALDYLCATTAREDLVFRQNLEPGDLQFLNNRAVMHGRTAFDDYEDLELKRLMLRLWLRMPEWPELADHMIWHSGDHGRSLGVAPGG